MNKKITPCVGDVWEHKKIDRKVLITYSSMMCSDNIMVYILFDGLGGYVIDELELLENYIFIGKSKVSIEELFDVKD